VDIANTSVQIAKDSKTVAELSNEVALATARDSAAMRIISAVTLFFLPATFTAVSSKSSLEIDKNIALITKLQTFFSTTFFNFQNEGGSVVSKKWIWLYPIVTLVLTGVTHFVWFRSTTRKGREIISRNESLNAIEMT